MRELKRRNYLTSTIAIGAGISIMGTSSANSSERNEPELQVIKSFKSNGKSQNKSSTVGSSGSKNAPSGLSLGSHQSVSVDTNGVSKDASLPDKSQVKSRNKDYSFRFYCENGGTFQCGYNVQEDGSGYYITISPDRGVEVVKQNGNTEKLLGKDTEPDLSGSNEIRVSVTDSELHSIRYLKKQYHG